MNDSMRLQTSLKGVIFSVLEKYEGLLFFMGSGEEKMQSSSKFPSDTDMAGMEYSGGGDPAPRLFNG